jgi:hypothetical protein
VYGYASAKDAEAEAAGRIVLGGCVITGDDPSHQCRACGQEYRQGEVRGRSCSKGMVGRVSKALCKHLAHNLRIVIQSVYGPGIGTTFWPVAPAGV